MKKLLSFLMLTCMSYAAFANATVAQKEWRWRNDNGSETSATWITAQDQMATGSICSTDTLRLRIGFQVNPDPSTTNPASKSVDYHLSYSTSPSGPWTQVNTSNTNAFMQTSSMYVTDGTSTTQQLVHSATGTYASGQVVDQNHASSIFFSTPSGVTTITEYEWVIVPTANIQQQTYYFMVSGLNSYPNPYPSITFTGATASAQTTSACGSQLSPSGNYTWTSSGTYNDTIMNVGGCDSVITTNLTILNSTSSTMSATACDSYVSPSGNYTWTASGMYNDTIQNMAGCDSVMTINLTINTVDATTTMNNETIMANSATGTYQWVDCNNNNAPIAGETAQSFTATMNGSYAVIVTDNGCSEMSACTVILTVGMNESSAANPVSVYPNPNNGRFTVESSSAATIEIYNTVGQLLVSKNGSEGKNSIVLENAGVYFVTSVDANGNRSIQKIVVTK